MSEISIDKKLELMHQIRSRSERDRFDMAKREMIVYGKDNPKRNAVFFAQEAESEDDFSTFPLRILLSVALFLLIVVCDLSGKSFLGIHANQCFQAIRVDYESSITAWVDAASVDE